MTTSAGDAFIGGYLASRLTGNGCVRAAPHGAQTAGVVIGQKGAVVDKPYFYQQLTGLAGRTANGDIARVEASG